MSASKMKNLDPDDIDIGLKEMMGGRYLDETARKPMVEPFATATTNTTRYEKKAQKPISKPVEEQWAPAKPEPSFTDKLKECAKTSLVFGGLNMLIWYWQIQGLMDESIALPCMLVCAAMCGLGIGKVCKGGNG